MRLPPELLTYGLVDNDVTALSALATDTSDLCRQLCTDQSDPAYGDFLTLWSAYPQKLGDPAWLAALLAAWQTLCGNVEPGWLVRIVAASAACQVATLAGSPRALDAAGIALAQVVHRVLLALCAYLLEQAPACGCGEDPRSPGRQALQRRIALGTPFGVLLLDLEKRDESPSRSRPEPALRHAITQRLQSFLRTDDELIPRSDGSWLLLLPDLLSAGQVALAALRIERELQQLRHADQRPVQATVGAALFPDHGDLAVTLIDAARLALEHARVGHQPWCWYEAGMVDHSRNEALLGSELRAAIRNDGLCLALQPQIDLASGQPVGAEALLRWQRTPGNWIKPQRVIAAVRRHGLRREFNHWLNNRLVTVLDGIRNAGLQPHVSFNLTAEDMLDADLPELLARAFATWNIEAEWVTVELTEEALISDLECCRATMQRLRDMGMRLALDDFGTGYASMAYLRRLPLQELKIDQIFVQKLATSEIDHKIVLSMINLAHNLGLVVVAEGIEDAATLHILREMGCDRAQGFLIARPLLRAEYIAWCEAPPVLPGY